MAMLANKSAAEDVKLTGKWKLVVLAFAEDEFAVFDFESADGKVKGTVLDAQPFLNNPSLQGAEQQGNNVHVNFASGNQEYVFRGKIAVGGQHTGQALGTLLFRGKPFPARLERTDAAKVATIAPRELQEKLMTARRESDAKSQVATLEKLLEEYPGPRQYQIYGQLLTNAAKAELPKEQVEKLVQAWLASARDYGDAWLIECRAGALKALSGQKPYAELTLSLAEEAVRALGPDATTGQQATALAAMVNAARLADKRAIADEAATKLAAIEAKLDEEYLAKVPPFKPAQYTGREKPEHDRVVLLELFTGAQCPPCVAADVAFDALLSTYGPKELVALQYHQHIPGPDPLTTPDSNVRMKYYGGRGTPSTYFNGAADAGGGGGMGNSESKYQQYRGIIDGRLADARKAKVAIQATRAGNKISLIATADAKAYLGAKQAEREAAEKKDADKKADEKNDEQPKPVEPTLRLRLALTEEAVRYVGGNQLRFHHHVVRGMPGGAEGKDLTDGQAKVELTVNLDDVRKGLSTYLDDFAANTMSFPNPLPEIELKHLALVAFLQDDSDHTVLDAVTISIPE
jgi:hypothetical protein